MCVYCTCTCTCAEYINRVFVFFFIGEMLLKMYAMSIKLYMKSSFNRFDFAVRNVTCTFPFESYTHSYTQRTQREATQCLPLPLPSYCNLLYSVHYSYIIFTDYITVI